MANKHNYNNDSIDLVLGAERIRKRPASMLGDNGLAGARHGITEILGNALDEVSVGYGDKLDVKYYKNGAISIRDYGRGVPLGWNEKRKNYNWHIIYNELYGGGKYDNGQWYLRSVDNWSIWQDTDKDLLSNFHKDTGVDLLEVPTDGEEYTFGDINVKRRNDKIYLRVNNASWSNITWEFLNNRLNYLASVGLNGLGASATQYTSEFFTVRSYRDGVCTEMNFKKGIPIINGEPLNVFLKNYDMKDFPPATYDTDEANGTYIYWKPDDEVFTSTDIGGDWLFDTLKDIAYVTGIKLHFEDENSGKVVDIEGGDLDQLVAYKFGKSLRSEEGSEKPTVFHASNFSHGMTRVEGKDFVWVLKVDTSFGAVTSKKENYCYHNSIKMQSGAQYYGIDNAVADFFNEIAKLKGIKLAPEDYEKAFGVCVSSYSNYASFRGQTKDGISDGFIQDAVYSSVYDTLKVEFSKGNKLIATVIDEVFERAERRILLREQAKLTKEANKVKKLKKPDKFVTCKAYEKKQYDQAELWIAEGDSANTSLKEARDNNFQALFPIRGKSLNVLKASIEKILANQEIKSIFALLGTGYDLQFKDDNPFDIRKLRFNKIIFATDADEDGYQIRVLLYLIFYRLAPELLRQGHVYIAETPRFEIVLRDGTKVYALDDKERDEVIKSNAGFISKINRFKGLGEVDADVLRKTTVAPEHRHLIRLSCDFENETERNLIDALFGMDKYNQRKAMLTAVLGGNVADMIEENALLLEEIENSDIEEDIEYEVVQ